MTPATDLEKLRDEMLALPVEEKLYVATGLLKEGGDLRIVLHLLRLAELDVRKMQLKEEVQP